MHVPMDNNRSTFGSIGYITLQRHTACHAVYLLRLVSTGSDPHSCLLLTLLQSYSIATMNHDLAVRHAVGSGVRLRIMYQKSRHPRAVEFKIWKAGGV